MSNSTDTNNTNNETENAEVSKQDNSDSIIEKEMNVETPIVNEISVEEKLKEEIKVAEDKYLRLYAEFENYRKRMSKERVEFLSYVNKEIIFSLLPCLDDFERALKSIKEAKEVPPIKEGTELIFTKLVNILEQKGLKPMKVENEKFDTDLHQAISSVTINEKENDGKIVDVIEKGYYLNDKILRYAKVIVGQFPKNDATQ